MEKKIIFIICTLLSYHNVVTSAVAGKTRNKSDEESFVNESLLGEILAAKTVASTLHNYLQKYNQSVNAISSCYCGLSMVAAATARTTESVTVTQLGNSYSTSG